MRKFIYKIAYLILVGVVSNSCSDYLDVAPDDKLLETQIYSSEAGINNVLNGVYNAVTRRELYGERLTMSTVEILAQRFTVDSRTSNYSILQYNYDSDFVKNQISGIWEQAYIAILNINDLIKNVDEYNTLIPEKANIVKGEAYGLRAMLHFDMLRLFGPIYSENPEREAIPYYTEAKAENGEILPANKVIELVLADLEMAAKLLENDPVIGMDSSEDEVAGFYTQSRNLRMNYFAVKALQARVSLYGGYTAEANAIAKEVIDMTTATFPWTTPSDVISAGGNPDRVFSTEVIFALQNTNLYERYENLFSSSLRAINVLYYNDRRLSQLFENNESDYRFNINWIRPTSGEITFKTFRKFEDVSDPNMSFRFMQPLVRISEMYYIVAETDTDETTALEYLNTVRFNRGLADLSSGVDIQAEIQKEYQREFYGEGQIFFYYKRRNTNRILNANTTSTTSFITMGEDKYVVPLPDSELKYQ
ncbi:RagB/SusD family nutrient uptake outer membrane protein [Aestuariibaculum suncheonense]|uniref:RagB/SusD family nutrient uptake outer membrane protein n=1 Tax=Aestuariibaculum suncheonense TaxID=1028745 RepID=A0A8J6QB79_9FLAO|nr:RagB/SusD family nutrient uptake outer membrane protein [Aestuariibaculum suncheonense]MBD0834515.1 RagB/SusD family nutrient uptake outer membrane protein [Aestuariibaculum suncheonense]